jgi:hypothetical protein
MTAHKTSSWSKLLLCTLGAAAIGTTGCQVHVGGQTLPSPYYLKDDVQYFAPGPEMKLSREAAAMKAYKSDQAVQNP